MNVSSGLPESVVIFGCGYVGTALAEKLLALGVRVGALTRNEEQAGRLHELGLSEVVVDDLDSADWHVRLGDYRSVVNCVSSAGGGITGYRKSYIDGQKSILSWARTQRLSHYIYTSSTSVYPQDGGALVDETADTSAAPETGQALLESERLIKAATDQLGAWFVFRLAGIYGPGRHFLLDQLKEGHGVIPGRGDYTLNLIHRSDIVKVIISALSCASKEVSGVYNVADDSPTHKEAVLNWIASELDLPAPRFDPEAVSPRLKRRGGRMPDRRIDNSRAREVLGWEPDFKSFRDGYQSLLVVE